MSSPTDIALFSFLPPTLGRIITQYSAHPSSNEIKNFSPCPVSISCHTPCIMTDLPTGDIVSFYFDRADGKRIGLLQPPCPFMSLREFPISKFNKRLVHCYRNDVLLSYTECLFCVEWHLNEDPCALIDNELNDVW